MIITVQLSSKDLAFCVKIVEGIGHFAIVKTLDGKQALAQIIIPDDLASEVLSFLKDFPRPITIIR